MEQPIIIRYRWTADALLEAHRYHFRQSCRPVFRFSLYLIFALMLVAGASGIWKGGGDSMPISIALLAGGIYFLAIRPFEQRWVIRRRFNKRPDRDMEIEWQVAADKILTQNGHGHSEFSWQVFTKMVRTPKGVLLYPTDQIFHWLPRLGFASDAEFERFVELAKIKVQRQYDVT
jgi:hypothetical protein